MKPIIASMIMAAGLMVADSASAVDMPVIARKHGCDACHAIDRKVVGPAWTDVARRYKGDPAAAARLGDKITSGGGGAWGAMPMPPNPEVSDAEKKVLVDFVLGLAR